MKIVGKDGTTEEELLCDYENVESEIAMNDAVMVLVVFIHIFLCLLLFHVNSQIPCF